MDEEDGIPVTAPPKNPYAVALGRRGGLKGGAARAAKLSAEERHAIATRAAHVRWDRVRPLMVDEKELDLSDETE